jgi:lipid-A-disaccharide synthase-like uncharacterized protein
VNGYAWLLRRPIRYQIVGDQAGAWAASGDRLGARREGRAMAPTTLWLDPRLWVAIGFLGQALFMSRMLVQWVAGERRGDAVVPVAFWWLSLAGGLITLASAIYNRDPVIASAQALGSLVYTRNLVLIRHGRGTAVMDPEVRGPHRVGELCGDRAA